MSRKFFYYRVLAASAVLFCCLAVSVAPVMAEVGKIPVPGMVTMVDVGAKACIPCKMMIPVIESLSEEYEGRAAIVFIDVDAPGPKLQALGAKVTGSASEP